MPGNVERMLEKMKEQNRQEILEKKKNNAGGEKKEDILCVGMKAAHGDQVMDPRHLHKHLHLLSYSLHLSYRLQAPPHRLHLLSYRLHTPPTSFVPPLNSIRSPHSTVSPPNSSNSFYTNSILLELPPCLFQTPPHCPNTTTSLFHRLSPSLSLPSTHELLSPHPGILHTYPRFLASSCLPLPLHSTSLHHLTSSPSTPPPSVYSVSHRYPNSQQSTAEDEPVIVEGPGSGTKLRWRSMIG